MYIYHAIRILDKMSEYTYMIFDFFFIIFKIFIEFLANIFPFVCVHRSFTFFHQRENTTMRKEIQNERINYMRASNLLYQICKYFLYRVKKSKIRWMRVASFIFAQTHEKAKKKKIIFFIPFLNNYCTFKLTIWISFEYTRKFSAFRDTQFKCNTSLLLLLLIINY